MEMTHQQGTGVSSIARRLAQVQLRKWRRRTQRDIVYSAFVSVGAVIVMLALRLISMENAGLFMLGSLTGHWIAFQGVTFPACSHRHDGEIERRTCSMAAIARFPDSIARANERL